MKESILTDKIKPLDHTEAYNNAEPFAHISFNNLFEAEKLKDVAQEFPTMERLMSDKSGRTTQKKLTYKTKHGKILNKLQPKTKAFCEFMNSPEMLKWLEDLTGIKNLIADDTFEGGGPHSIKRGGFLKMHVDFNVHPKTRYDRRLNVLVYLNDNWEKSWGGYLEMWKDMKEDTIKKSFDPLFNTTVIFNTTDKSWHGHPDPMNCPEHIVRRSLAFYYYTKPEVESEAHNTIYVERPGEKFKK